MRRAIRMRREKDMAETRAGSLQRNNVYSSDDVRGWADRIHCGPGGIRMNEKFLLVGLAKSSNPRGVCELPVRYLADYIGVGIRQAQRIIQKLIQYELVAALDVAPQGRPNDIVRKFILNVALDPDTWEPPAGTELPLMRHLRAEFRNRVNAAAVQRKLSDVEHLNLLSVHFVVVRSKQLDFVSTDVEVTNTAYRYQKLILELASQIFKTPVLRLHMIPKKGYRERA